MHRATNVNAKDHRGITPMMMAARLNSINMIEELIEADADINAADNEGRSKVICWQLIHLQCTHFKENHKSAHFQQFTKRQLFLQMFIRKICIKFVSAISHFYQGPIS